MDDKISESVKIESPAVEKKENECKPIESTKERKNMKEEKGRKKDDKSIDHVLKALNSLDTADEKLAAMCKKYTDIVEDNRKLQLALKQSEKKIVVTQREKDQFQSEHSKAILTRSRLESLCRELQRQNKAVKDESLIKIKEEEEKRKEVSAKFQSTLSEITTLMNKNNEKNTKLHDDNLEMTKKFKSVCEQYEIREQQVEKMQQQMKLESQLAEAKLAKAKMEMAAEKEILLKDKQQLLLNLTEYEVAIRQHQAHEVELRGQLQTYADKYEEFQNALTRSNNIFLRFKDEMEKMSKKILKLEKETSSWKQRWENSHAALLKMAADKQQRDAELAMTSRKLAQLQQLCRALQGERASLLAQLRGKDENAVVETTEQSFDNENVESLNQVDNLSKDCQQLKENLVQLQDSLAEAIKKEMEEKLQKEEEIESEKLQHEIVSNGNDEELKDGGKGEGKESSDDKVETLNSTEYKSLESEVVPANCEIISEQTKTDEVKSIELNSVLKDNLPNTEKLENEDKIIENSVPIIEDDDKSLESISPATKKGKDGKKEKK